jgi:hypothetical protein
MAPPLRLLLLALATAAAPAAQVLVPDDDVPGVLVAEDYDLRLGLDGLNYPSNITLGEGRIWITEAGFPGVAPTVKEITLPASGTGTATIILTPAMLPPGTLADPFTDLTYRDGMIWLVHRQTGANDWLVGAISRFDPDDPAGTFQTVLTNLPSAGDHTTDTIVFGADGRAYFSQGSATNSAVVGPDNASWLMDFPDFHEFSPVELVLNGDSFVSRVPSALDPDSNAVTAPYRPFDSGDIPPGYVVPAATPSTPQEGMIAGVGTVYSFDPAAANPTSTLRLEAWGLRNPFGLAFDTQDPARLFISNNGSDIRGQPGDPNDPLDPDTYVVQGNRPIAQDEDEMFVIEVGGTVEFFGWPDFMHDPETNEPLSVDDPLFCMSPVLQSPADCPRPIFAEAFRDGLTVAPAFSSVGLYVSVTGFAPSASEAFGYEGDLFITESGSFSPQTGAFEFTGYKVSRVDDQTGEEVDFVVNDGDTADELFVPGKMNKPVSVAFDGNRLLIVDLGVLEPGIDLFQSSTGKVWVLTNTATVANEDGATASGLALRPVYPNPAAGTATVTFRLPAAADVRLAVYDVLGREVAVLAERSFGGGDQTATIPTDGLPAGLYIVRLDVDGQTLSRRFTVGR